MAVEWYLADDYLLNLARDIIREHHVHLLEAKVAFIYRSEPQKSAGKYVLGHAEKVSEKMKTFIDFDFVIWISQPNFERMEGDQQRALVDHQLCHCGTGENGWMIKHHDFEEFIKIIERHGMWSNDLQWAGKAFQEAKQPTFIEISTPEGTVATLTGEQLEKIAKKGTAKVEVKHFNT